MFVPDPIVGRFHCRGNSASRGVELRSNQSSLVGTVHMQRDDAWDAVSDITHYRSIQALSLHASILLVVTSYWKEGSGVWLSGIYVWSLYSLLTMLLLTSTTVWNG